MSNYAERASDIVRAVHLLRQHGMAVGFPMQTANREIIFPVGKDFTLTTDQILELLERGELNAEGVRKSVESPSALGSRWRRQDCGRKIRVLLADEIDSDLNAFVKTLSMLKLGSDDLPHLVLWASF